VTAYAQNSVVLPATQPGDTFEVQVAADGKLVLTRLDALESPASRVTVENRDGFSVGVLDRPINERALTEALNNFP
jgi:hypothetical protein